MLRSTRSELANAIFEWIETFYNPIRRHASLRDLSQAEYETLPPAAASVA
ncbi:IS3 family transposase [Segniliparus rotundus]